MGDRPGWYRRTLTIELSVARVVRWLAVMTVVAGLAVAAAYLGREPLLGAIGRQLVHDDPLERVDVMVVLSGGVPAREIEAADLYRDGWARRVVLPEEPESPAVAALRSRGIQSESTYDTRRRLLHQMGVPPDAIVTPPTLVRSTADEAVAVRDWLLTDPQPAILVVTSLDHTARARMIFSRTIPSSTRLVMRGARTSRFQLATWWRDRITLREGLIEWQKSWWYRVRY